MADGRLGCAEVLAALQNLGHKCMPERVERHDAHGPLASRDLALNLDLGPAAKLPELVEEPRGAVVRVLGGPVRLPRSPEVASLTRSCSGWAASSRCLQKLRRAAGTPKSTACSARLPNEHRRRRPGTGEYKGCVPCSGAAILHLRCLRVLWRGAGSGANRGVGRAAGLVRLPQRPRPVRAGSRQRVLPPTFSLALHIRSGQAESAQSRGLRSRVLQIDREDLL